MKYIKLLFATILVAASLSIGLAGVAMAADADIQGAVCQGAQLKVGDPSTANCDEANEGAKVDEIVSMVINIFSWIVGVVCVIMIIYGGFRYVTAGGDSANVTKAKDTILYAIIGLVIVALAQIIVKFVISKITTTTAN